MAEAAARFGDAVARRGSETLLLTARSAVTAAAAAGSPGPVATSSRLLNPACVLGESRKSKLAGTFRVAGRREAYQNQLGEEGGGHVSCDRPPVRLVSSPSYCWVSGVDDASRSEGVQVPTSYSVVERVNERALVSSNRELLFSSSAQARVDNGSQVTFRCPRSGRACGDSPLESHVVEQMEQGDWYWHH